MKNNSNTDIRRSAHKKRWLMALSEELPIYKVTFRMLGMVVEKVKSFPRFYRYAVGEKMVKYASCP